MEQRLYKDMTADELRESYNTVRTLLANASAGNMPSNVVRLSDRLDLIVRIARKRDIPLTL